MYGRGVEGVLFGCTWIDPADPLNTFDSNLPCVREAAAPTMKMGAGVGVSMYGASTAQGSDVTWVSEGPSVWINSESRRTQARGWEGRCSRSCA